MKLPRTAVNLKTNWFWGLIGVLGVFGYVFHEPVWYVFFAFFLFFLEPIVQKSQSSEV